MIEKSASRLGSFRYDEIHPARSHERHADGIALAFVRLEPREKDRREQLHDDVVRRLREASALRCRLIPQHPDKCGRKHGCCAFFGACTTRSDHGCVPTDAGGDTRSSGQGGSASIGIGGPSSGTVKWNVVVSPGTLSAQIRPP